MSLVFAARRVPALLLALALAAPVLAQEGPAKERSESDLITGTRQLTFEGRRAGEGYYSMDGRYMAFQSEREAGNPFYQIYLMDLETGDQTRISPGFGKTTCSWVHPDNGRVLYASTHLDPRSLEHQKEELEMRASGKARRYEWDYDENFDLFAHEIATGEDRRLTYARGYDAEGSYSPDGRWICFASNRSAYLEPMSEEDRKRFEIDKSLFMELYMAKADGSEVRRLTFARGYDGGPFFSYDGKKICWRRFSEDGTTAEIYTMNVDGSDQRRLSYIGAMSWAPYFHPSGEYLIFTTNRHGFANFELYLVDPRGDREPVRVTYTDGFDGLPTFTPDGATIAWTATRTADGKAQIFVGNWNHEEALRLIRSSPRRETSAATPEAGSPEIPVADRSVAAIRAADLGLHVTTLAAPEMGGRLVGSEGERRAAEYVAGVFERLGLEPGGDEGGYFQGFEAVMLDKDGNRTEVRGRNVLGVLRAAQAGSTEPPLVVGAHVDHLGKDGGRYSNAKGDEKWALHLGADDNASGVAGLLEIAEYLVEQRRAGRFAPVRDVVFAAWSGEEIGAFGSKHFVREMRKALGGVDSLSGKVAAYLNLDMIGRFRKTLVLSGVGSSSVWRSEIERRNAPIGLAISIVEDVDLPTDTTPFYIAGVPILNAFTGAHEDYHTPRDTVDKLDFAAMERIAKLMGLLVRSLALDPEEPDYVPHEKDRDERPTGGGRPYLGTIPDYAGADIPGVALDGVATGGPAHAAGVRGGDVIVELGGVKLEDIYDYTRALEDLSPGVKTTIVVMREGKRLTFDLVPGSRE